MKQLYITFVSILLFNLNIFGQEISGLVTNIDGEPLVGANIVWENTSIGTISDIDGTFTISDEGIENRTLIFSFVGFNNEKINVGTLNHWEIMMIEDNTLTGVEISTKSRATRYADNPAKIEVIGTREIERAACCSLAGCFSTNSNVVSATTNVITDAKELQILGLSGVYNQLLFDDLPMIQGLSYQYGTGSYPGTTIKSIFVAKGSNSVLQGAQSISGQINIIPHNADESEKLYLNAFANSFGSTQYNANYAVKKQKWNNFLTAHLTTPAAIRDKDGDGFRDIVKTNRVSFYNKWTYQNPENDKFKFEFGARLWKETREGGQNEFNAEQHLGTKEYYGQHVDLIQGDLYAKFNYSLTDDLSITVQNSNFKNIQDNHFGVKRYEGEQFNSTTNVFMDLFYGKSDHNLKFGISYINNQITETISELEDLSFIDYAGEYDGSYSLPGAFIEQALYFDKVTVISGLRVDQYQDIGFKLAPRLLVRYEVSESSDFRVSIGKGIRVAHLFSERINLLSGNRNVIFEEALRPEEAINTGLNYIHSFFLDKVDITLSGDAYYTIFQNQIFPDYDREISTAFISNFTGESVSKSFQLESKFSFQERYDLKLSYNYLDLYQLREDVKFELPFVPKHKILVNNSYSTLDDNWQFDLTYKWFSEKRLPITDDYPVEYQLNDYSQAYSNVNFQITKRWPRFEIYGGMENIFDFRQEFPILASGDPFGRFFDPAFNWGPTKGREYYLGLRFRVE